MDHGNFLDFDYEGRYEFTKCEGYDGHCCHILKQSVFHSVTDNEALKSICRILGPLANNPTLGVQHAVEAGYLFKEHASISAWFLTFFLILKSPNLSLECKQ